jgi:hypothetical protein
MNDWRFARGAAVLATLSAAAMVIEPTVASAQSAPAPQYQTPPPPQYNGPPPPRDLTPPAPQPQAPPQGQYAPQEQYAPRGQYAPQDQYAPAPPDAGYNSSPAYQQTYQDYRARYDEWAMQNCVTERNNNVAAGAIFGGVAGALMGFSLAGWAARGAWALFGGSVGMAAGAAIAGSSQPGSCPNGYAVRAGAPAFNTGGPAYAYGGYYAAPAYAPRPYYGPRPYSPWVWVNGRWVRRGYGYHRPLYRPPGYEPAPYRPY